ncbi:MAG TPA: hypothetical protein VGZ32_07005 [Actinocrinis sp.]|jgi:hypothetical protein|uniref:hypothetical protein n=1 Tax=Actinocrinis sp. TaxID=1920516 RepID=UPI002DDCBFBE|nr:hypothetical protein [Actinocrinis sp.]HEV3170069.1 hypothetical protein [Actinocrinis sp.]
MTAVVLVGGALTTAYASPWSHKGDSSSGYQSAGYYQSNQSWMQQNVVTGTTTTTSLSSTVPSNGDVNPYGVATVPMNMGYLYKGDVLVSNYNNKANTLGTGSTIVEINPTTHKTRLFSWLTNSRMPSACPGGIGLTDGLVVLRNGWVIVASLPASDGTYATAKSGCLIVLNSWGKAVSVITGHGINGPWAMTAVDHGSSVQIFVANILNGWSSSSVGQQVNKGTVVRLDLWTSQRYWNLVGVHTVASGLPEMWSKDNFVQGVTGLAVWGSNLFISDSLSNRIAVVHWATTRWSSGGLGFTLAEGGLLQQPLGIVILPRSAVILIVNGNNGNLIAVSQTGRVVLVKALDTTAMAGSMPGAGTLFDLAASSNGQWAYYVDDSSNTLGAVGPLRG